MAGREWHLAGGRNHDFSRSESSTFSVPKRPGQALCGVGFSNGGQASDFMAGPLRL